MFKKIQNIAILDNFVLELSFLGDEIKQYDFKENPLPEAFNDLFNIPGLFQQVKVDPGGYGISWNDDLDLSAEELWMNGK